MSDTLKVEGVRRRSKSRAIEEEEGTWVRVGVVGAEESLSARSLPLPLNELILGGEGARVEEECWALVKSLEIEAVAVDVAASAGGGGLRGSRNLGGGGRRSGASTTTHGSSRRVRRRVHHMRRVLWAIGRV